MQGHGSHSAGCRDVTFSNSAAPPTHNGDKCWRNRGRNNVVAVTLQAWWFGWSRQPEKSRKTVTSDCGWVTPTTGFAAGLCGLSNSVTSQLVGASAWVCVTLWVLLQQEVFYISPIGCSMLENAALGTCLTYFAFGPQPSLSKFSLWYLHTPSYHQALIKPLKVSLNSIWSTVWSK